MKGHLEIKIDGKRMTLPADFSLDVTEENFVFHDVGMHSDPVSVSMKNNRSVFRNIDHIDSSIRPISIEHLPAEINVKGIPFRNGTVVIQEDEELEDSFAFNIDESRQSFTDLINDLKCQDVPLFDNERIPVGQKVSDVHITVNYNQYANIRGKDIKIDATTKGLSAQGTFEPQALGFSYPGIAVPATGSGSQKNYPNGVVVKIPNVTKSYINVTEPYQSNGGVPAQDGWRYCNARVCYTHYNVDTTKSVDDVKKNGIVVKTGTIGETTDEVAKVGENYGMNEDYGPFWVLDANRPQSGICFYVLYFLDCLFHHLGVSFDNSALTAIEDFRRLCFFTTKCKYVTDLDTATETLPTATAINDWLQDRGCGGRIEVSDTEEKSLDEITVPYFTRQRTFRVGEDGIDSIKARAEIVSFSASAKVATMYATSENFPNESVSKLISSLENSFGIRFHYDYQLKKVTAYLLRDLFRQRDGNGNEIQAIELPARVLRVNKLTEKITGVRVKYSAESDPYEQKENVRKQKRDYDTDFDYVDYRQGRTKVSSGYKNIANDLHTENVTCYIDTNTANAYRFKISRDLDTNNIAYHRLFEVGQFHGIEEGDCSKVNDDFVHEMVSDFQPMSFNDVNAYAELKLGSNESLLAAFIDAKMEHEFVTQKINHTIDSLYVDVYATEALNLLESYDPNSTDDGNSPLQSEEWGLSIALMRGGGTNATVQNYSRDYDGFGNSKWRQVAGTYAMASDTMDQYGYTFDYNGDQEGDGGGERFSLKIRSCKPFLYYIDDNGKTVVTSDLSLKGTSVEGATGKIWLTPGNGTQEVERRGLADVFLAEWIWFLLNRRKLRIHCLMEISTLIAIRQYWTRIFRIGKLTGYIDKLTYQISAAQGIGEVEIDFYAI